MSLGIEITSYYFYLLYYQRSEAGKALSHFTDAVVPFEIWMKWLPQLETRKWQFYGLGINTEGWSPPTLEDVWNVSDKVELIFNSYFYRQHEKGSIWEICRSIAIGVYPPAQSRQPLLESSVFCPVEMTTRKRNYALRVFVNPQGWAKGS